MVPNYQKAHRKILRGEKKEKKLIKKIWSVTDNASRRKPNLPLAQNKEKSCKEEIACVRTFQSLGNSQNETSVML
jgi:hypothetical protein